MPRLSAIPAIIVLVLCAIQAIAQKRPIFFIENDRIPAANKTYVLTTVKTGEYKGYSSRVINFFPDLARLAPDEQQRNLPYYKRKQQLAKTGAVEYCTARMHRKFCGFLDRDRHGNRLSSPFSIGTVKSPPQFLGEE